MIPWLCLVVALAGDGPPEGWTELQPSPAATPAAAEVPPAEGPPVDGAAPPPVEEPPPDGIDDVVLVLGDHVVAERRAAVVRAMEKLGWKSRTGRDGVIRFHGTQAWMGKAKLYPSGDLEFIYVPITVSTPKGYGSDYQSFGMEHGNAPVQPTAGATFGAPSAKKVRAIQDDVRAEVQPLVIAYREAIQGRALAAELEELPDRLGRLWSEGLGLDLVTYKTPAERRAALLDYWATRTNTPEGRAVMRQVELFIRNVVQDSPDPVTPEEAAAAEGRREDGRSLGL